MQLIVQVEVGAEVQPHVLLLQAVPLPLLPCAAPSRSSCPLLRW